jgi:hypothetical protein
MRLRLRSQKPEATGLGITSGEHSAALKRIVKRPSSSRALNKRRRVLDDDMGRDDYFSESDLDNQHETIFSTSLDGEDSLPTQPPRPMTPKRSRIAPEVLPLGLERLDYHSLHADGVFGRDEAQHDGTDVVVESDGDMWSAEDDRILVELVLEKLKLSKSDWQDCARSLGKDRGSVGRRWKSLMISGDIGLKRTSRRGKLHGTWR